MVHDLLMYVYVRVIYCIYCIYIYIYEYIRSICNREYICNNVIGVYDYTTYVIM